MISYTPSETLDHIHKLIDSKNYTEAIELTNEILTRDPSNEEALLTIADIYYRKGNMDNADKAVDFLNYMKKDDPLGLYIKGLLEMEKNNWKSARTYFNKAMNLTNGENHEIIRCYGLSEYRYGNRERGRDLLKKAFQQDSLDAEVIYNIIQLSILEQDKAEAEYMISFFHQHHDELKTVDKSIERYDKKIALLNKFFNKSDLSKDK